MISTNMSSSHCLCLGNPYVPAEKMKIYIEKNMKGGGGHQEGGAADSAIGIENLVALFHS